MLKMRTTKTASGKTAVQVVERAHQKTKIVKHIGSAGNDDELKLLWKQAERYIVDSAITQPLFPELFGVSRPLLLSEVEQIVDRLSVTRSVHTFAHEFLSFFYEELGLTQLSSGLLRDLAFLRLIEPCSKLRSIMLLQKYFGIDYTEDAVYEGLPKLIFLKEESEKIAVSYATQTFGFDFSLVFYDVTTLYYESFKEDEDTFDAEGNMIAKGLRKGGLGKEIKIGQPIIVIGLMVTKEGFPISYEVYEGNTFEGDTFIPSILSFKKKHSIQTLTIVADAAMISFDNVEKLKEQQLSYIVGGRIANLKNSEMKQIHAELISENQTAEEMQKIDGKAIRIQTERGLLLCNFSLKRYLKDKREMEKQISRAEKLVTKNTDGKRTKFLMLKQSEEKTAKKRKKKGEEKAYALNTKLIEKTKLLLGIKGYYTNLFEKDEKLTNTDIINHYHSLWHVEKAFRIAKSDLQARPIFHHKRESIEAHILIVFVSLCLAKAIELKTNYSIRSVKDMIWDILDITFTDRFTGKQFVKRMDAEDNPMVKLLEN
jgi:hypothetical protein